MSCFETGRSEWTRTPNVWGCRDGDGKIQETVRSKHSRGGGGKHWGGRAGEAGVGMPLFLHPLQKILSPSRNAGHQVNRAITRILYTCLSSRRSSTETGPAVNCRPAQVLHKCPLLSIATPALTQHPCFSKQALDGTVVTGTPEG